MSFVAMRKSDGGRLNLVYIFKDFGPWLIIFFLFMDYDGKAGYLNRTVWKIKVAHHMAVRNHQRKTEARGNITL